MKECADVTYLKKVERALLLIKTLNKEEKLFDTAKDAHRHIRQTLEVIENKYVGIDAMSILPLSDFEYLKKERLYVFQARKHTVFIHLYGAYGIYENVSNCINDERSFCFQNNYYKTVVEFKNIHGLPLFEQIN
jgi:hypothetical protein